MTRLQSWETPAAVGRWTGKEVSTWRRSRRPRSARPRLAGSDGHGHGLRRTDSSVATAPGSTSSCGGLSSHGRLGHETPSTNVSDMAHHTAAVARTTPDALIVADLPWMSYHNGSADASRNAGPCAAGAPVREAGRREKAASGHRGPSSTPNPVMGHLGLTPHSFHAMGGFKVQARSSTRPKALVDDARALADSGCFAICWKGFRMWSPSSSPTRCRSPRLDRAGSHCDGQVLVFHESSIRRPAGCQVRAGLRLCQATRRRPKAWRGRPNRSLPDDGGNLPLTSELSAS